MQGHDPADYARALGRILREPGLRAELSAYAVEHAAGFSWARTADRSVDVYRRAAASMRADLIAARA